MMIMPKFSEFPMFSGGFPVISPLRIRMRGLGKPAASGIEVDFSELKELLDMLVDARKSVDRDSETAPNNVEKEKPFMWSTSEYDADAGDDDDNEEPYIHEPDVIMSEDDDDDDKEGEDYDRDDEPPKSKLDAGLEYDLVEPDAHEDDVEVEKEKEQNSHMPKSILEMKLEDIFGPIVSNKAFKDALRNAEKEDNPPPLQPKKDPFVFIANNLTFLIKTGYPVLFDTSSIKSDKANILTIAIDVDKTFPKLEGIEDLGFITSQVNSDKTIQDEIKEYLSDTEFTNIYCFPDNMINREGCVVPAIKFVVYEKKKTYNF